MMQAADFGYLHDPTCLGDLDWSDVWRILVEGEMCASPMIVLEIACQDAAQVPLTKNENVIQTLQADRTDQAFGETENERLLQRVLMRGYITPATSHEQAAHELNLSRSAYFRRLSLASQRVAEYLSRDRSETEARPIRH